MMQTPLFAAHQARNAHLEVCGDWMLAQRFTNVQAEVDATRKGVAIFDLAYYRTITLTSPEVRRWTNGMFSNNIRRIQPNSWWSF